MKIRILKEVQYPGFLPLMPGDVVEKNSVPCNQGEQLLKCGFAEEVKEDETPKLEEQ